jgi:hypothetical protein
MKTYEVWTRNGPVEFNTSLTEQEAHDILKKDSENKPFSDFRDSLIRGFTSPKGLSQKQALWLLKLAQDSLDETAQANSDGPFKALFQPFQVAGLKRLKMRFGEIALSTSKATSPNKDHLYVFWNDAYAGKVTPQGHLKSGLGPAGVEKLREIAEDPLGAAIRYGRETGQCSCCGRELSDPVSIFGGIGPVCLERVAGSGARKALEQAFKQESPDTLAEALKRAQFVSRQADNRTKPQGEDPKREDFASEQDYILAKAIGGI